MVIDFGNRFWAMYTSSDKPKIEGKIKFNETKKGYTRKKFFTWKFLCTQCV